MVNVNIQWMGKSHKTAENFQTYFHSSLFNNSLKTLCHRIMIYCRFSLIALFTVIYFRVLSGSYIKSAKIYTTKCIWSSLNLFFWKGQVCAKKRELMIESTWVEDWYMCTLFRKPQLPHQQGVPISWGKKGKISVSFVKIFLGWKYPSLKNISCGVLVCKN